MERKPFASSKTIGTPKTDHGGLSERLALNRFLDLVLFLLLFLSSLLLFTVCMPGPDLPSTAAGHSWTLQGPYCTYAAVSPSSPDKGGLGHVDAETLFNCEYCDIWSHPD